MNIDRQEKGITLVALVITIIILLILAGITIRTLSGENGLIAKANQAKKAQIEAEMKEKLILAISELQTEKEGKATLEDITQEWVNGKIEEYTCTVSEGITSNGKQILIEKDETNATFLIDEKLNISEVEDNSSSIAFSYDIGKRTENKVEILIHIQDKENGLSRIELPGEDAIIVEENKKEEKGIDYEVEIGKEYKIKIISENGAKKEETILVKINETEIDLKSATYSGDLNYLDILEDRITINSVSDWKGIFIYMDNINLIGYDQIEITFSFDAGYDWGISLRDADNNGYVVLDDTSIRGHHNSLPKATKTYDLPKGKNIDSLCFVSSSLNAKLHIYNIKLINYK